jgi:hypothetical protein
MAIGGVQFFRALGAKSQKSKTTFANQIMMTFL